MSVNKMTCKCGSQQHHRTSSKHCPLYSPRKVPPENDLYKTSESVYKIGLDKFCQPKYKKQITKIIRDAVRNITQVAFEGTLLLNLYLLDKLENDISIFDQLLNDLENGIFIFDQLLVESENGITLYDRLLYELENGNSIYEQIFDRTFLRPFFTIMASNTVGNAPEEISNFFQTQFLPKRNLNFQSAYTRGLTQCVTILVKEYLTNLEIHVRQHSKTIFVENVKQELKFHYNITNNYEISTFVENITTDDEERRDNFIKKHPKFKHWIDEFLNIQSSSSSQLKYMYEQNKVNMEMNGSSIIPTLDKFYDIKIQPLIPLYSWNAKYITIDSNVLFEMFHHITKKGKMGKNLTEAGKKQKKNWNRFFKIPPTYFQQEVDRKTFSFMIKTDGSGVSVHLFKWKRVDLEIKNCITKEEKHAIYSKRNIERKNKEMLDLKEIAQHPNTRFVGIDPGKKSLMTVYNEVYDNPTDDSQTYKKRKHFYDGKMRSFTNKRYYTESKFRYTTSKANMHLSRNNLLIWSNAIPPVDCTTSSLLEYLDYIYTENMLEAMFDVKCSKQYTKLRWTRYIHNKQTIYNFCNEVFGGHEPQSTIILYGDASYKHNMKGTETSPLQQRFVNQMRRLGGNVMMTSEFNTSLVCSTCNEGKRMEGLEKAKNSYVVRKCQTTTCGMIWNRDHNAARNIMVVGKSVILTGEKPEVFTKVLPKNS